MTFFCRRGSFEAAH